MDILDYIPTGHENAISRGRLRDLTGLSDRQVREQIAKTRHENVVLNLQDGSGYFQPDINDKEDQRLLHQYVSQEEGRLRSIGWSLKAARRKDKEQEAG